MWTPTARAELARESRPYATCLTDAEWVGFGRVDRVRSATFADLDEAQLWIADQLSSHL